VPDVAVHADLPAVRKSAPGAAPRAIPDFALHLEHTLGRRVGEADLERLKVPLRKQLVSGKTLAVELGDGRFCLGAAGESHESGSAERTAYGRALARLVAVKEEPHGLDCVSVLREEERDIILVEADRDLWGASAC
jgi:hypothetical protein